MANGEYIPAAVAAVGADYGAAGGAGQQANGTAVESNNAEAQS